MELCSDIWNSGITHTNISTDSYKVWMDHKSEWKCYHLWHLYPTVLERNHKTTGNTESLLYRDIRNKRIWHVRNRDEGGGRVTWRWGEARNTWVRDAFSRKRDELYECWESKHWCETFQFKIFWENFGLFLAIIPIDKICVFSRQGVGITLKCGRNQKSKYFRVGRAYEKFKRISKYQELSGSGHWLRRMPARNYASWFTDARKNNLWNPSLTK